MARRRGNMLEAFQVSRERSLQAQQAAQRAADRAEQRDELMPSAETVAQRLQRKVKSLRGVSGGLLAVEEPSPSKTLPKTLEGTGTETEAGTEARRGPSVVDFPDPGAALVKQQLDKSITLQMGPGGLFLSALALILISFWGGYRIGERRGSAQSGADQVAGTQQAAWMDLSPVLPDPGALPAGEAYQDSGSADGEAQGQINAADLAFEDPQNQFTLVVDQHNDNNLGWDRALASYQYLQAQGLPAIYPRTRGDVVYLLVGASPDSSSLGDLLQQVQSLAYPGSQDRTFSTAYQERIENFF